MKQGDEGRFLSQEAPAVTVMRLRREVGFRMIRGGATTEAIMAATGASCSAVKLWRRRIGPPADAPVALRVPTVLFEEKGLADMADVPLGAW